MHIETVSRATWPAVSVDLMRQHIRVRHMLEDELLRLYIDSATELVERHARIAIVQQRVRVTLETGNDCVPVPLPPYIGNPAIVTLDHDATVPDYTVVPQAKAMGLRLDHWPHNGWANWPVQFTYDCGYMTDEDVPSSLRHAVLMVAAHNYANREATTHDPRVSRVNRSVELGMEKLLEGYVVPNVHWSWHDARFAGRR